MILINPQFNRIKKLGIFSRYVPISLPIGIATLAGYLIKHGKQAKLIDDQLNHIDEALLRQEVKDLKPPYIFGLSCFSAGVSRVMELANLIKKTFPDCFVIAGGIHPTVMPEEMLANNNIDIVVRREGDEILLKLYDLLKSGACWRELDGISYRQGEQFIHNPNAPVMKNLDNLPPFPYHLFGDNLSRYHLGFILSSRGCPYNCIFCSQKCISGSHYRFNSNERVIDELDILINKFQQKSISFFDDNFVVNKQRTKELCQMIYDRGFNKQAEFEIQTRGDAIDEEVLSYLKMANITTIAFGLETGSDRLLKVINKNETLAENIRGVKLAKKHGFKVMASFILGLPSETRAERWQAYKMAKDLDLDYAKFNNPTPYPGTELYDIAISEGTFNPGENWENLSACGTFVEGPFSKSELSYYPKTTTSKKLSKDILKANMLFWFRPKQIWKILKSGHVGGGWLTLPDRWYFKPKEIWGVGRLGVRVSLSFIKSVL